MSDLASLLKLSYLVLDVLIYMPGKMTKNVAFIVFSYFVNSDTTVLNDANVVFSLKHFFLYCRPIVLH